MAKPTTRRLNTSHTLEAFCHPTATQKKTLTTQSERKSLHFINESSRTKTSAEPPNSWSTKRLSKSTSNRTTTSNIANAVGIGFLVKSRLSDVSLLRQRLCSELTTGLHAGGRPLLRYKDYRKATVKN